VTDQSASAAADAGGWCRRVLARAAIWLLLAAVLWYAWRGPVAAWSGFSDFALVYGQARVWAQGGDPYDHPTLLAAMAAAGVDAPASFDRERWPAIYPPTMHPLMAPLALLPWVVAKAIWLVLNVAATLLVIALSVRLAGLRGTAAVLFAAGALAFAPLLSGIAKGQLALVSLVLALDAWSMARQREGASGRGGWLAGVLLGLGMALKPQIAGVVWLALVWRGRWRAALTGAAVAAGVGAVGAGWLWFNDVAWLEGLRANLADNAVGGSGDPTSANPLRFQLINLHYLLAVLLGDDRAVIDWGVRITAGLLAGAALVLSWLAARRRRGAQGLEAQGRGAQGLEARDRDVQDADLLLLGVLAAVSLLAVYHRAYDAVLLYPAAAWSVREAWIGCRCARGRLGVLSVWVLAVFLLPGAALPHLLAERGLVPAALADSWFWQAVVLPHQVWALLAAAVLWLGALGAATMCNRGAAWRELKS
jgi:hypothetical protein